MNARMKETGSVLKVTGVWLEDGSMVKPDKIEFLLEESQYEDLEKRRFELVKAATQGLLANPYLMSIKKEVADKSAKSPQEKASFFLKDIAEDAVELADAILAEYHKGGRR